MSKKIIVLDSVKTADALLKAITSVFPGITEFTSKTRNEDIVVYSIGDAMSFIHIEVSSDVDPKLLEQLRFFAKGFEAAYRMPVVLA
jgi:hypothetical protein